MSLSEENRALIERVRQPGDYAVFPSYINELLNAARAEGSATPVRVKLLEEALGDAREVLIDLIPADDEDEDPGLDELLNRIDAALSPNPQVPQTPADAICSLAGGMGEGRGGAQGFAPSGDAGPYPRSHDTPRSDGGRG